MNGEFGKLRSYFTVFEQTDTRTCRSIWYAPWFEPEASVGRQKLVSLGLVVRDGVVVRASASQSVDLGFIPLVESYQQTLKNGIYSFPAWRSAFMGGCGEQAGKLACCVLGQGT